MVRLEASKEGEWAKRGIGKILDQRANRTSGSPVLSER